MAKNIAMQIIGCFFAVVIKEVFYFTAKQVKGEFIMEKQFDYKAVAKEIGWNFKKVNCTTKVLTKFDYWKEVKKHLTPNTVMIDVGCGSAEKILKLASPIVKKLYLTDNEPEMLKKAAKNAEKYAKNVIEIQNVDMNFALPYPDNFFDLVVARHSADANSEVFRVLKKGGTFVSEDIAKDDCQELKNVFGRGQNYFDADKRSDLMKLYYELGFEEVSYYNIKEIEFYHTKADLVYLLKRTPILNVYDEVQDDAFLDEYISKNTTSEGIKLSRKLYGFKLTK